MLREAEEFFGLGADGFEGGSGSEVGGDRGEDVPAVEGGGGFAGEKEGAVFDEAGLGEALAGEDFGEEAVIGGEVDPAGGGADGEGGAA